MCYNFANQITVCEWGSDVNPEYCGIGDDRNVFIGK
jgi:hypothetical protein